MTGVDAIILTGGRARRLGGVDKASVRIGDATLLEHALEAVSGSDDIVVVGPTVPGLEGIRFAREDPPGGGPVAGITAGLAALAGETNRVLVLACDMPHVAQAVPVLLEATVWMDAARGATAASDSREDRAPGADGAWGVDDDGRAQPLCAVYRRDALHRALDALGEPAGSSMRALSGGLEMTDVPIGRAARDADTWDDVKALREERG